MIGGLPRQDRGPWFEVAGHPVNAPLALVAGCILSMLLTTAALAFSHNWEGLLGFSSAAVLQKGEVWRVVSYALWNPPSISLALDMLMLWWFGRELEGFFGRAVFLKLCTGVVLAPALAGLLTGLFLPVQWSGLPGTFALFVAFAAMAPGVVLLFGVTAKWTALIFLGLQVLSCVAGHAWSQLVHSLVSAGFAFGYIRLQQGRWSMPEIKIPVRRPQFRVLEPVPAQKVSTQILREEFDEADALELIDPLLEKIGKSGMSSLTAAERAQLELAREALIRKGSSRR